MTTSTRARPALFFTPGMPTDKAQARYRALTKVLHPDTPTGDTRLMQLLNLEFEALERGLLLPAVDPEPQPRPAPPLDGLDNYLIIVRKKATEMIQQLPHFQDVYYEIDVMGRYILALGNSYEHKEQLKTLKFRWQPARRAWVREILL